VFKIFRVSGTSMQPTLVSGDYVLATSIVNNFLKKNSLVVFFDNTHSYIIKRIKEINKENLFLKSDNLATDSAFCQVPITRNKPIFLVLFIFKKK
tara:strand:+ start:672 stop:956 length:285 start_codon:yes stop_codon:yes gene_type:complete